MNINRIEIFKNLIKKEPTGRSKYIFIVSSIPLEENIIYCDYIALMINKTNLDEFIKCIDESVTDTYISKYVFLLAGTKTVNDKLADCLNYQSLDYDNSETWKIFNKHDKGITYYSMKENTEELKKEIDKFINKCEGAKEKTISNEYGFEIQEGTNSIKLDKLDYGIFANYMIKKYHIVQIDNLLHYYNDGLYPFLEEQTLDLFIMNETYNSRIHHRKEIYKYIKVYSPVKEMSNKKYILFNNGVYDLEEQILNPISNEYVFLNRIPHNYNASIEENQVHNEFLFNLACGDGEIINLLNEVIGYCFYRDNPLDVLFYIVGSGGNGKSTFFSYLEFILGKENVSFKEFEELRKETNLACVIGKLLNISDDIDPEFMKKVSTIKKLVSGEPITIRKLYQDPKEARFTGKELASGNDIPKTSDTTNGMSRRLKILPFEADFINNPDLSIKDKLFNEDVAEYAIYKGLEALKQVLNNKKFTDSKKVHVATTEYQKGNNPIIQFIEEFSEEIQAKEVDTIYKTYYTDFCKDNGYMRLGKYNFIKKIEEQGYKKTRVRQDGFSKRPYMFKLKN